MDTDDDDRSNPRLRWLLGGLFALGIPMIVLWWPGCRQYPELSNRDSIILNQALYSVCASRDPTRIPPFEAKITAAAADGTLTETQAAAFRDVLALAKSGDWDAAKSASYSFAEDQVR